MGKGKRLKDAKKKKPLDPKWVNELIDYMIGPQMAVMMMKAPSASSELTVILRQAIGALYEAEDYPDTNAWVVAAANRLWDLYNTYMTAKLIQLFDQGIPDKPRILSPGSAKMN
jgi:hypothetical protein